MLRNRHHAFETPFRLVHHWHKTCLGAAAAAILFAVGGPASSHDENFIIYVAEDGTDAGDCRHTENPCQTLDYALKKAGKGDKIRVATGTYRFDTANPNEVLQLLGDIVDVRAGYDRADNFSDESRQYAGTDLIGPSPEYRQRLLARGFSIKPPVTPKQRPQQRLAQAGSGKSLYVAASGVDTGQCTDPANPCGTMDYALAVASSGDTIQVAAGAYLLRDSVLTQASQRAITLQGGFVPETAFTSRAVTQAPSYVIGSSFKRRDQLQAQGFFLVQDTKAFDILARAAEIVRETEISPATKCVNGMAGIHPCKGIDLLAQMPLGAFSSQPDGTNDIWGFVDLNDKREYAIIGLRNGTAVVDVTDPENPTEVGTIAGQQTIWRDIKVYQFFDAVANRWKAYAYVTADAVTQGFQIIDLTTLPTAISLATTVQNFASAHNVYMANIDYATGQALPGMTAYAYILGSNHQGGSYRILDLANPVAPALVTAAPIGHGYTHDSSNLLITDGRTADCGAGHNPCEVLIDYNESTMDLWDVTDKSAPIKLSSLSYANAKYTHSGWWSKDKRFVFIQDELDERDANLNTTLHVVEISDLKNPVLVNSWTGPDNSIDHNGFTLEDEYYMSNYRRGLVILDISDPAKPKEARFFDTFTSPPENNAAFNGAWGTYPYLPSGTILVSDIENGLFLLKKAAVPPPPTPGPGTDNIAFAWANKPTAASYQPSATYAHNPAGPITATRTGKGRYAIRFAGFGGNGKAGGNVQVTAYGGAATHCKVTSWSSSTADFIANVRCVKASGAAVDERFVILVNWPK